jgi:4-hydroxy-tetrahydrodipicolinate synthase
MDERDRPKAHTGVIVPLVTPLTEKGELDEQALRRLVDFEIDGGVDGIFVLGSTGEGPSLPRSMRARVVHQTLENARGRVKIYAGILENSVVDGIAAAREYLRMGVSGIVAPLPNYYTLSPDEQFLYFTGLAERIQGAILLYEIPQAVHMTIDLGVIEHLRAFQNVVGIKDSSGDRPRMQALLDSYRDDPIFSVLVGASSLYSYGLRHGADGIVPGAGNIDPGLCVRMCSSARKGDWTLLNELQLELDSLTREFLVPEYMGQTIVRIKRLMSQRGLCGKTVLPPLEEDN